MLWSVQARKSSGQEKNVDSVEGSSLGTNAAPFALLSFEGNQRTTFFRLRIHDRWSFLDRYS